MNDKDASRFFLIGPMGSGKTTVGLMLADRLSYQFYDSDAEIERKAGADVPTIFELKGEAEFRRMEEQVIEALTGKDEVVVATGGGAVLSRKNTDFMTSRGAVIYLDADVDTQLHRVSASLSSRPLLQQGSSPRQILEKLYHQRKPLYEQIADVIVAVNNVSPDQIADEILLKLRRPQPDD